LSSGWGDGGEPPEHANESAGAGAGDATVAASEGAGDEGDKGGEEHESADADGEIGLVVEIQVGVAQEPAQDEVSGVSGGSGEDGGEEEFAPGGANGTSGAEESEERPDK
jgi:hypothetical protein